MRKLVLFIIALLALFTIIQAFAYQTPADMSATDDAFMESTADTEAPHSLL